MMDEKINFQFESICDAGQKGWKNELFSKEDMKQMETYRE
jgi:hypothetical protein